VKLDFGGIQELAPPVSIKFLMAGVTFVSNYKTHQYKHHHNRLYCGQNNFAWSALERV